jgi:NAD(P)-dependent dehydrogenase (short-subunit alcohol dehydrogenase family)
MAAVVDIADTAAVEAVLAEVDARYGRLDGLVHVAAMDVSSGGLVDGRLADWDEVAAINVRATMLVTAAAVPLLERARGSVVFVGAGAAHHPDARFPMLTYAMSKGALVTGAWHLSRELGARGIRVNTVTPVYKWGPALEAALEERAAATGTTVDELAGPIRDGLALGEFATDDDVAEAITFFCSPRSRRITGQTLVVDGGQLLT